jgi:hypothetical protein
MKTTRTDVALEAAEGNDPGREALAKANEG